MRDVALSAIAVMESPVVAERYIINGENISYQHFLSEVARALDKKIPNKKAPYLMVQLLHALDWLRSKVFRTDPLLTKETIRTANASYFYANNKVRKELGYQFFPMAQTILETAQVMTESKKNNQNFGLLPIV